MFEFDLLILVIWVNSHLPPKILSTKVDFIDKSFIDHYRFYFSATMLGEVVLGHWRPNTRMGPNPSLMAPIGLTTRHWTEGRTSACPHNRLIWFYKTLVTRTRPFTNVVSISKNHQHEIRKSTWPLYVSNYTVK